MKHSRYVSPVLSTERSSSTCWQHFSKHSLEGWGPLLQGHIADSCFPWTPPGFLGLSYKAALYMISPSPYQCMGQFFSGWPTLPFPLLNFMRLLSDHLSSLLRSMWMAARPSWVSPTSPSFVASANLWRVYSA